MMSSACRVRCPIPQFKVFRGGESLPGGLEKCPQFGIGFVGEIVRYVIPSSRKIISTPMMIPSHCIGVNGRRVFRGSGGVVGGSYGFIQDSMPSLATDPNQPIDDSFGHRPPRDHSPRLSRPSKNGMGFCKASANGVFLPG
jgi:hypothetical protein